MKNICFKEYFRYTSLNVLGMIGLSWYILADTFFVSKSLGANGLTALNLAIPIYSFIHGSGLMLGVGGSTKYAILKSQRKSEEAKQAFTNTVILAFVISACLTMLALFFSKPITAWLGADEAVFEMCNTYLKVILLFSSMFIMNNVILCFVRNDGYPNLSMFAMIAGSLSNIVLDYVFMFPLNMGIFGAVLATGIAPIISLSVLSWIFLKKKNGFQIIRCKLSLSLSKYIISSGIPSLITEVSSGIVMIVFNFLIMQLAGNVGVAAYGVIANLSLVVISIYTGIAQGIQPLMSRNYGSGKEKEVHTILKYALLSVTIIYLCIYICIFFGADSIVNVFNNDQNPNLQKIAFIGLKVYFLGSIFAGYNIVLSTYYTSTENPRPAHIISLLRGVILVIPIAFLLSSTAGMLGVWCVFPLTEFLVSGVALRFYHLNKLVFA